MKKEKDYIQDIAEIRSMMERSSKFLSLSGWAGIMAGVYALTGVGLAIYWLDFGPQQLDFRQSSKLIGLAVLVLLMAVSTAVVFSYRKADRRKERLWNTATQKMLIQLSVPLVTGGVLMLILACKGELALLAPLSLLFYGLALYNAGNFSYGELRMLGLLQVVMGLAGAAFLPYSLLFWALGFGLLHIAYGIFIHFKYER